MTRKNSYRLALLTLIGILVYSCQKDDPAEPPMVKTVFGWETATNNGTNITETIDGITVTFTGTNDSTTDLLINSPNGFCGSSNNVAWEVALTTSVTFSFSKAVHVISVLALNGNGGENTYTLTPTGGSNSPVTITIVKDKCAPVVNLNWTDVTSFTVSTPNNNQFGFDDLVIESTAP